MKNILTIAMVVGAVLLLTAGAFAYGGMGWGGWGGHMMAPGYHMNWGYDGQAGPGPGYYGPRPYVARGPAYGPNYGYCPGPFGGWALPAPNAPNVEPNPDLDR